MKTIKLEIVIRTESEIADDPDLLAQAIKSNVDAPISHSLGEAMDATVTVRTVSVVEEEERNTKITKEELLDDFREWSGGFTPDECDDQITVYLDYALPYGVNREDAEKLLESEE